jgi:hypothetical protein
VNQREKSLRRYPQKKPADRLVEKSSIGRLAYLQKAEPLRLSVFARVISFFLFVRRGGRLFLFFNADQ